MFFANLSGCLQFDRAPTLVRIFGNGPNSDYSLKISLNLVWICSERLIFSILDGRRGLERGLLVGFWALQICSQDSLI